MCDAIFVVFLCSIVSLQFPLISILQLINNGKFKTTKKFETEIIYNYIL